MIKQDRRPQIISGLGRNQCWISGAHPIGEKAICELIGWTRRVGEPRNVSTGKKKMKMKMLFFILLTGLAALQVHGQAGNNAGTGTQAGSGTANQGAGSQSLPPNLQNRQQLPPGLRQGETLPRGFQATNQFGLNNTNPFTAGSNQFGAFSNRFGSLTNRFLGISNRFGFRTNQLDIVTTNLAGVPAPGNPFLFPATNGPGVLTNQLQTSDQFGLVATNQLGGETNLSPTAGSNTPNRIYNLPPGFERRNQLPPGLQNRDTLPPGLEGRTNAAVPRTP